MTTANLTPMTRLPNEREELLEEALCDIFELHEAGVRLEKDISAQLDGKVSPGILGDLKTQNLVKTTDGRVEFSVTGKQIAHEITRRKRLAERLLKDVLNVKDEFIDPAACQWEHILSKEVTDSICTLLGHPTLSPRDQTIPAGECCRSAAKAIEPVVCSLEKLNAGDEAKIAYLMFKQNPEVNRLLSLGLIPGISIKILQRFPTYVVQANESQLAFDDTIAKAIFVHPL